MIRKVFSKVVIALHGIFLFLIGKAPKRKIPAGDMIISPAHGRVIEIREVQNSEIIFHKKGVENHVMVPELVFPATIVVIEMTPLDVHVQRAPISGTLVRTDHYKGRHKNAMGKHMIELVEGNEKVVSIFANDREKVAVVQVAGIFARRIRNILQVDDEIEKGDIYGRIRFGSQVVVIIPPTRKVQVAVGDRVIDGETVLAR